MGRLTIIFLGLGSLLSAWIILAVLFLGDDNSVSQSDESTQILPDPAQVVTARQVITTWGNEELSAAPLLQHSDTQTLVDGEFHKNSADPAQYDIYYDQVTGSITVLLASNPLSIARNLAEIQLQYILGLPNEQLCDLRVKVAVNAAVNQEYARQNNLGLSFCPGAVQLP